MNLLKFYRVKDWVKNLGICLIGLLIENGLEAGIIIPCLLSAAFALAYTFAFNDFYDFQEMKEKNYLGKLILENKLSRKFALFLCILPGIFSLLVAGLLNYLSFMVISLFIVINTLYSHSLFRLRNHWKFSLPINTVGLGILLFIFGIFSTKPRLSMKAFVFLVVFSSYIFLSELIHQISHKKKDKRAGVLSFPIEFGNRKTLSLAKISQFFPLTASVIALLFNSSENLIFLGTIVFSSLRLNKLSKIHKRINFEELRENLFGFPEGIYYLMFILLESITEM